MKIPFSYPHLTRARGVARLTRLPVTEEIAGSNPVAPAKVKNQRLHWNQKHEKGYLDRHSIGATDFAREIVKYIPDKARVLDLGTGIGNDAKFFTDNGYEVLATDLSDVVIKKNIKTYGKQSNLVFQEQNIAKTFDFEDESFDAVYARLSIHYFTNKITRKIFDEIARVLSPGGSFIFMCKSVDDYLYGKGEEIEPNMYIFKGHIRHFFSEHYTRDLLSKLFRIEKIWAGEEDIYGRDSAFVKVVAIKR